MVLLDRWDIGLVPFPFADKTTTKKRAALVLSNASFNGATDVTIFAMITKAQFSAWPGDYAIEYWQGAGLLLPSVVRMKCFSLENSLILHNLGRLHAVDIEGAQSAIRSVLG